MILYILFLTKKKNKKFKIFFNYEKKELGTMGPLSLMRGLPKNFLVMNGDILTNLNIDQFFKEHLKSKKLISVAITERKDMINYGVLKIDNKSNEVISFHEKPRNKVMVSMGIYILNKKVLKYFPRNKYFGFDDLMKKLIKNKIKINIKKHRGKWLDIGRPEDYEKALNSDI